MTSALYPCVYIFRDADDRPLYIGSTRKVHARLINHMDSVFWPQVCRIEITRVDAYDEALDLERQLIGIYEPPFNIAGVVEPDELQDKRTRAHQRGRVCGWHNCRLCADLTAETAAASIVTRARSGLAS